MRRTVGWVVGVAVSIALTGVAGAASMGGAPHRVPIHPEDGRQRVGVVEQLVATVGYAGRTRTFRYPGASYVKLHLSRLALLPGDYLTVADPGRREVHTYRAGTGLAELTGGWAMSVAGDTAVVALHSQRALGLLGGLGATVDRVARGFTARERTARSPGSFGGRREESVCGSDEAVDAVCYRSSDPTAYHRSKAVARLLINGVELCTAWRVGPHNRMLTNHHCFTDTESARNTEVWFDYMCASCGGYDVFRSTKVWGDQVLATDDRLDFTLFTVANFATVQKFGYLEFDLRRPAAGEELYVPQNPGGDPTVIAMGAGHGQCAVDNPSYDGYDVATDISYYCDTAGGSSGSPVLSMSTDKVLALHHFGGCPNSGVRIDLINHEIASLL